MSSNSINSAMPVPVPQSSSRRWLEVLLIVLVFFVATGDPVPNVNETHYIARLKHYWNPQWCAGDMFLESPDTQVVFIWLFGWLTRWLSLAATAWIGRVVAWALVAWSWQRLSWRIIPRRIAAVLSAALFLALNNYCQLAGEWIVGGVEGKCFAYAFVLLALSELIDRRWNMVLVFLGAAMAFHPIVGGWSAIVCAGIWLWTGRREQAFRTLLPGIVVGGLLALVGLVPVMKLTWHEPAELVAEANRIYVFERLPHHLSILSLPQHEVWSRLGRHATLLLGLWIFSRSHRTGTMRHLIHFAWGAALIAAIGLAFELSLWYQPFAAARWLRYYWFRLTDFAAPMAVSLQATYLVWIGFDQRRRWAWPLLVTSLLIAGVYLEQACGPRVTSLLQGKPLVPAADAKVTFYPDWVEACDWIAANTPPDALFLTPRLNQSFKWRTGRPEVAIWKDLPQDARSIVEWYGRLKDIYYTNVGGIEQPLDSIGVLGTDKVRELAKKYHAAYVLMDRSQLLTLPIVFRNEEYVVYRIEDRTAGNSR